MGNCFLHGQPGGGASVLTGDAVVGEVLTGKKFYKDDPGTQLTGTMPNRGEVDTDITTKAQVVTIAEGYHNGNGTVQIDATEQGKLIAANIASGVTILGVAGTHAGAPVMDGNAAVGDVLATKTFYNTDPNTKETGTMTNVGAQTATITTVAGTVTPTQGYHNGSGSISIAAAEQAKLIAENIASGVTILGVAGSHSGSATLTGDAAVGDVRSGKTFYNTDPDTKLTGTWTPSVDDLVTDGIIIKTRDANGRALTVDFYGTQVKQDQFRNTSVTYGAFAAMTGITFKNSVTSIGVSAFQNCNDMLLSSLPVDLATIGAGAFATCSAIAISSIPNGVTYLEGTSFSACTGITSINAPRVATVIGSSASGGAFYNCTNLASATIGSAGYPVSAIGPYAFTGCGASGTLTVYTANGQALANAPYGWTGTVVHQQA